MRLVIVLLLVSSACGRPAEEDPPVLRLVELFDPARLEGVAAPEIPPPTVWRFDGTDHAFAPDRESKLSRRSLPRW